MDLQTYQPYWDAVSAEMLLKMQEFHALLSQRLPDGFSLTPPTKLLDADEFSVSMDVTHPKVDGSVVSLDFKVLDSDLHGGDEGVGLALAVTGYGGLAMGGYYPGNYTPEAFTTAIGLISRRVAALPVQRMAEYTVSALSNPCLRAVLTEAGQTLN